MTLLTIGALARRAGVRPSAIRYYEAQGILPPSSRLPNGYRIYPDEAVGLVRLMRRAQGLGITLAKVKEILSLVHQGEAPCDRVKDLIRGRLREIDQRIRELLSLQKELEAILQREPRRRSANQLCPMLEEERPPESSVSAI
ncbi:MAG: MerR family transcriptional regulator [Chromatiales bacterium]